MVVTHSLTCSAYYRVKYLVLFAGSVFYLGSCTRDTGSDVFTVRHAASGQCLCGDGQRPVTANCNGSTSERWKWVSNHRLFHVDSGLCLGLKHRDQSPALLSCNSAEETLWWRCDEWTVYTALSLGLSANVSNVTVQYGAPDRWTRDNSTDNICQRSYRVTYTTQGNSYGIPCDFPFLYNGNWHHECLLNGQEEEAQPWCATTPNYDRDGKWGYCLLPEKGCGALWEKSSPGFCYQNNLQSMLTWQEARASCHSQEADLLSFSSPTERSYIAGNVEYTIKMWIGLHHLDVSQGWQWSDGSPLSFVNWNTALGMPITSRLSESDCGAMNSHGFWESESCERKLPYICKKRLFQKEVEPEYSLDYNATFCEAAWIPWNRFCYMLSKETPVAMNEAQQECEKSGANLISLHHLSDVEMIGTSFSTDGDNGVWIGLKSEDNPAFYKWTDGTAVTFTQWDRDQPQPSSENSSCVAYFGGLNLWRVLPCETKLPFVCKKSGNVSEVPSDCPADGVWKRHGNACYKVDVNEVLFEDRCNLTIMDRFEQEFINALIKEYIKSGIGYFWLGLRDVNHTGEFKWISTDGQSEEVTFTNWNSNEPVMAGGCVVLATTPNLGKWEVKDCAIFRAASICKVWTGEEPEPEPEPDPSLPCPDGWESFPDMHYCYKVFHKWIVSRKRSWEEAERFCEALGAHLPSIGHNNEMTALRSLLGQYLSRYFWIGMNRRNPKSGNSWEWSDGRPVSTGMFFDVAEDEYVRNCVALKKDVPPRIFPYHYFHLNYFVQTFQVDAFHCDAQLEWVCQIPRGKKVLTPEWYHPDLHHETSISIDGSKFWFVKEGLTYYEATEYCWGNNSRLASPQTYVAFQKINQTIQRMAEDQPSWWIDVKETLYQTRYSYFQGFRGYCVALNSHNMSPDFKYCRLKLPFVCERINATHPEDHTAQPRLPCDRGSHAFRDKCYTVIKPVFLSYTQAQEQCAKLRGTLLSISSQAENDFIGTLLSDQPPYDSWIGLITSDQSAIWVDKSPLTFRNFNPLLSGQTRYRLLWDLNPLSWQKCALIMNDPHSSVMGTWNIDSCDNIHFLSICQHYADKPEEPKFPDGNITVGNYTYRAIQGKLNWSEARDQCMEFGMDLASVPHIQQQFALTTVTSRANTSMWIGLISEDDGDHYHWSDHSAVTFNRWSPEATAGPCVYLDTEGFWKNTQCEDELEGAICQIPLTETPAAPKVNTVKCPHQQNGLNWIPFRDNCYAFQLTYTRWHRFNSGNVRATCTDWDKNSTVLTIRDEMENEFVRQQLVPFKDLADFVWLGIFSDATDNRLKWYDGTNIQFSKWANGRPSMRGASMAGLDSTGYWHLFPEYFWVFQRRTIVACKIDNEPKNTYQTYASDFKSYGNLTYHIIEKKLLWSEALEECQSIGGHLASAHDSSQDAHLELMSRLDGFSLWIGLSRQGQSTSFEWSDGTNYVYSQELENSETTGECVVVNTKGSWQSVGCQSRQNGAICYNTTQKTSQKSSYQSDRCPVGSGSSEWVEYKSNCYAFDMSFYKYMAYTKDAAKVFCQTLDASSALLTIKDQAENDFVSQYLSENPLITSRVWLDLNFDEKGQPGSWADGSPVEFAKWQDSSNTPLNNPNCAVMLSGNAGNWTRVTCTDIRSRVVCKLPIRSYTTRITVAFFFIAFFTIIAVVGFLLYRRHRSHSFSRVQYHRNFNDEDSTNMITEMDDL